MYSDGVRNVTIDLKDFFFKLGLLEHEYVKIKISTMPAEFVEKHD